MLSLLLTVGSLDLSIRSLPTPRSRILFLPIDLFLLKHQGILQMTINLPQAITPAFTTSTFAVYVDLQILGYLHWVVFFVLNQFRIFPLPRTTLSIDTMFMPLSNDGIPYSNFAGAVHSLVLKEPTHDWREEAATAVSVARKAKASASVSRLSTLVHPLLLPPPLSLIRSRSARPLVCIPSVLFTSFTTSSFTSVINQMPLPWTLIQVRTS